MKRIVVIMLILLSGLSFQSIAQGNLLVAPTQIMFAGNKEKEEVNLVNTGKDTATYSITLIHYNMKEDGSYVIIQQPDSGQMFADPYLRIFPRKVTLPPGESQVIMLQCRRFSNMLPGEYRSHLYFRSEKDYEPLSNNNSDTTKIHIQLIPIFGISIPIIIRSGAVNVSTSLTGLKLDFKQDSSVCLNFTIKRTGNISCLGNIIIQYIPLQGNPYELRKVRGVNVFTNITKRNFSVILSKIPGLTLKNGKLKVMYTSPDEAKYVVYNEATLDLK